MHRIECVAQPARSSLPESCCRLASGRRADNRGGWSVPAFPGVLCMFRVQLTPSASQRRQPTRSSKPVEGWPLSLRLCFWCVCCETLSSDYSVVYVANFAHDSAASRRMTSTSMTKIGQERSRLIWSQRCNQMQTTFRRLPFYIDTLVRALMAGCGDIGDFRYASRTPCSLTTRILFRGQSTLMECGLRGTKRNGRRERDEAWRLMNVCRRPRRLYLEAEYVQVIRSTHLLLASLIRG